MLTKAAPQSDAIDAARAERYRTRRRSTSQPTTATQYRRDDHESRRRAPTSEPTDDVWMTCVYCGGDETPLTIEHGSPICADCLRVISEELADDDADDELEPYDWTAELED